MIGPTLAVMLTIPRPVPENAVTFTYPDSTATFCVADAPMHADSVSVGYIWRDGKTWRILSAGRVRGAKGTQGHIPMPFPPGKYMIHLQPFGPGGRGCSSTFDVEVPRRLPPTILDLKAEPIK